MTEHVALVLITCRKVLTFFRVLIKSRSGRATEQEVKDLASMQAEYVENEALWKKQMGAVDAMLKDGLRRMKMSGKVVRRQDVEDIKDLLHLQEKLFRLSDLTLKIIGGEKEKYEKIYRQLFLEFVDHQRMWTDKMNEVRERILKSAGVTDEHGSATTSNAESEQKKTKVQAAPKERVLSSENGRDELEAMKAGAENGDMEKQEELEAWQEFLRNKRMNAMKASRKRNLQASLEAGPSVSVSPRAKMAKC